MDRFRLAANLATLANGLVGVGAVLYVAAGNPLWAMLLIASGVVFDGMDGLLSRKSPRSSGAFGRVADSVSDAITFGAAPAALIAWHSDHAQLWGPWLGWALVVGVLVGGLAVARLVYFTLRGFQYPYFLGAPTPQTALAVIVGALFLDVPGFLGVQPAAFLVLVAALALLMVVPIPFPKIRRGSTLRPVATVTALALALSLFVLQFRPPASSVAFDLALAASLVASFGTAAYYIAGPSTVQRAVGGTT
ncbi:MAG: CDP-alcohol phosphatidyltransferase family protein [Thermoplasmata archaeon]|nr:CDP-alcohol phosphatidyltransferase family protein [Thermoplasmata archaeon]